VHAPKHAEWFEPAVGSGMSVVLHEHPRGGAGEVQGGSSPSPHQPFLKTTKWLSRQIKKLTMISALRKENNNLASCYHRGKNYPTRSVGALFSSSCHSAIVLPGQARQNDEVLISGKHAGAAGSGGDDMGGNMILGEINWDRGKIRKEYSGGNTNVHQTCIQIENRRCPHVWMTVLCS